MHYIDPIQMILARTCYHVVRFGVATMETLSARYRSNCPRNIKCILDLFILSIFWRMEWIPNASAADWHWVPTHHWLNAPLSQLFMWAGSLLSLGIEKLSFAIITKSNIGILADIYKMLYQIIIIYILLTYFTVRFINIKYIDDYLLHLQN